MIWILIYFVGCVVAYRWGRTLGKRISFNNKWTKGDRRFWLTLSLLSWLTAIVAGGYLLIFNEDDSPASW